MKNSIRSCSEAYEASEQNVYALASRYGAEGVVDASASAIARPSAKSATSLSRISQLEL